MRVLLTGAAGFIGNRIGVALHAAGHEVVAARSDVYLEEAPPATTGAAGWEG